MKTKLYSSLRALLLAILMLQTSVFAFSMFPIRLTIDATRNVATLSVANPSDQDITLQPRVYKWTQEPNAQGVPSEKLTESTAFTVFPPLVTLKPQAKQTIRIRYNGSVSGLQEEAFRVITEDLMLKPTPGIVNFANAVSIPLFVKAKVDRNPELVWQVKRNEKGQLHLDFDNSVGNRHIQLTSFTATKIGTDAQGALHLPHTQAFMQYLLPKSHGRLSLDKVNLTAGTYNIKLTTDYKELEQTVEIQ